MVSNRVENAALGSHDQWWFNCHVLELFIFYNRFIFLFEYIVFEIDEKDKNPAVVSRLWWRINVICINFYPLSSTRY